MNTVFQHKARTFLLHAVDLQTLLPDPPTEIFWKVEKK